MLRGTGDDVLSCGHLESLTGSLNSPATPAIQEICGPWNRNLLTVAFFQVPLPGRDVYALLQLGEQG